MPDRTFELLKSLYNEEFAKKYLQKKQKAEELPKRKLEEIKAFADEHIPASENFAIKYDNYDVLLVEVPRKDSLRQVKETSAGNYKTTVIWRGLESLRGPFLTVFTWSKELAEEISRSPNAFYYIIGTLKERQYQGEKTYTFNMVGAVLIAKAESTATEEVQEISDEEIEEFFSDSDVEVNL